MFKGVTLRGLEVFEALGTTGSVAQSADITGLSQPAVSQQLSNLEKALGTELLDRARRPMRLTAAGRGYHARVGAVLRELRLAQNELSVVDLGHLETLSIGMIDDFDDDLTPRLVTELARTLTRCRFKMITAPSHEISAALEAQELHLGVAASSGALLNGVVEYPLVRDPYVLVAPAGLVGEGQSPLDAVAGLPLLRYEANQLNARLIEARLAREGLVFAERFEIGSHLALMAMVARRIGWAITTPLGYMRAARFHDGMSAHPLPFDDFARRISLFSRADWSERVPRDVAASVRRLVDDQILGPVCARLPWLAGEFRLLEG